MITRIDEAERHYAVNWTSSLFHRAVLLHINYSILLPFSLLINHDYSERMNTLRSEIILLYCS